MRFNLEKFRQEQVKWWNRSRQQAFKMTEPEVSEAEMKKHLAFVALARAEQYELMAKSIAVRMKS